MNPKRLTAGVAGGLAGGLLFGIMMQAMGMLGMIAGLVGEDSAGVGWVVHLAISALFGLIYAVTLGRASTSWGRALVLGALYGVVWWALGALLIMPAWMGMPVFQVGQPQLQSLVGHLVYGVMLGAVFQPMTQPARAGSVRSHA